jgi:hypothetical protein
VQGESKPNLFEFAEPQPKSCKQFAAAEEIDTPMYSKMEHDAKWEQITIITNLLQNN